MSDLHGPEVAPQARPLLCAGCGSELSSDALYCAHCGASQTTGTWEECQISSWRGYVYGEFIAVRLSGGPAKEIARSPSFRWPRRYSHAPERPRVTSRLDALEEELLGSGWERSGKGDEWYSRRYRRQVFSNSPYVASLRARRR